MNCSFLMKIYIIVGGGARTNFVIYELNLVNWIISNQKTAIVNMVGAITPRNLTIFLLLMILIKKMCEIWKVALIEVFACHLSA